LQKNFWLSKLDYASLFYQMYNKHIEKRKDFLTFDEYHSFVLKKTDEEWQRMRDKFG